MKWKPLVSILCIVLFLGSVFIAFKYGRNNHPTSDTVVHNYINDEDSHGDEVPENDEATEKKDDHIDRETYNELIRLHEKYRDVYAWIEVPGTKIDYPILRHETDDEYYLHHDMAGDENMYGSIFTEAINSKSFKDPNTVIYGHNMSDESMFGTLRWFEDEEFFYQNSDIIITTLEEVRCYRVIAAYRFSDDHLLKNRDMFTREGIRTYLNNIPEYVADAGGFLREDIERKEPIITLSSCATGDNTYRLLVQAVLVSVESMIES